jgi:hypothetical protein
VEILVEGALIELAVVALQLALARLIEWIQARTGRVDPDQVLGTCGNARRGLSLAA